MIQSHILPDGLQKSHWNWEKQLFQFVVWYFRHVWTSWNCLHKGRWCLVEKSSNLSNFYFFLVAMQHFIS